MEILVIGGGAAGFFSAIICARNNPGGRVVILERAPRVLAKVLISGGGRCNVTNACFDPKVLVRFYPRGQAELLGPFHRFGPRDIMEWFEGRGTALKTESEARVFPVTDKSQTIADVLMEAAREAGVQIRTGVVISSVEKEKSGEFSVSLSGGEKLSCVRLILATGGGRQGYEWARSLGHAIEPPVPSLFTFAIDDARLRGLAGLSSPNAEIFLEGTALSQSGPVLITHWGLSGPAVLKLSAWGARILHERGYKAQLRVNWLGLKEEEILDRLERAKISGPVKTVVSHVFPPLPRRLSERLAGAAGIPFNLTWANVNKAQMKAFARELTGGVFEISGRGVFKEEFVTCGGVRLNEINFKTMESKICPGLYFAGEILDIDGVTGGFNFQSAWTTGWLAGQAQAGAS